MLILRSPFSPNETPNNIGVSLFLAVVCKGLFSPAHGPGGVSGLALASLAGATLRSAPILSPLRSDRARSAARASPRTADASLRCPPTFPPFCSPHPPPTPSSRYARASPAPRTPPRGAGGLRFGLRAWDSCENALRAFGVYST